MPDGDRVKMECPTCGYKSFPQWLNDQAHCLKCDAVLKTRPSVHEKRRPSREASQIAAAQASRVSGESSLFKQSPGSAMESTSSGCEQSPDGLHHWKFGMCSICRQPEGKLAKGPGVMANPGSGMECPKGGKCMFKFAVCTKCGGGEAGLQPRETQSGGSREATPERTRRPSKTLDTNIEEPTRRLHGEVSTFKYAAGSAMESQSGECSQSPNGMHHWKYGKCNYCQKAEGVLVKGAGATQNPGGGGGCPSGGKCMYKFGKCTKCGGSEFGGRRPSREATAISDAGKVTQLFKKFDKNGDGTISRDELKEVLLCIGGAAYSAREVDKVLEQVDVNEDGVIDHEEFVNWLHCPGDTKEIFDRMKGKKEERSRDTTRGPERFFYDKSSYTGTHAK